VARYLQLAKVPQPVGIDDKLVAYRGRPTRPRGKDRLPVGVGGVEGRHPSDQSGRVGGRTIDGLDIAAPNAGSNPKVLRRHLENRTEAVTYETQPLEPLIGRCLRQPACSSGLNIRIQ
jgi:hypothetical protein